MICSPFDFKGLVVGEFRLQWTDLGANSRLTSTNLYGRAWQMADGPGAHIEARAPM